MTEPKQKTPTPEIDEAEKFWQELEQAERERDERYRQALEEERDAWLYVRDEYSSI